MDVICLAASSNVEGSKLTPCLADCLVTSVLFCGVVCRKWGKGWLLFLLMPRLGPRWHHKRHTTGFGCHPPGRPEDRHGPALLAWPTLAELVCQTAAPKCTKTTTNTSVSGWQLTGV